MKNWGIAVGIVLISISGLHACEACGCGISFGTPGPMTLQQRHFLGWMTTVQRFAYTESETYDSFIQSELWGRWAVHPRWAVTARVPFHVHQRTSADSKPVSVSGLGDIRAQIRYLVWQQQDTARKGQYLFLQTESRLPTSRLIREEASVLPFRFYPGQNQWIQQISAVHVISLNPNWAVNTELSGAKSLSSDLSYRLGSQLGVSSVVSRSWEGRTRRISAWAGLSAIFQGRDIETGYYRNDTGGQGTSGLLGAQWETPQWSIGLQGQIPLWQQFGANALTSLPAAQLLVQYRL